MDNTRGSLVAESSLVVLRKVLSSNHPFAHAAERSIIT